MSDTTDKWCRVCADEVTALRFGDGAWRCCNCGGSDCLEGADSQSASSTPEQASGVEDL